jgi:hypothetical protein
LKGQKTALYKALIESFNLLKNITGRKTVLLISDGRNEDASVSQMDVLNFASAYKIQVIVLALIQNNNTPAQETFLTNLARETGGQYIRINGPDSLGVPIYEFAQQRAALPVVEPTLNVVFNIPPEYVPDKNKVEVLLKKSVGDGEVNQSLTLKVPLEKVQAPAAQ